MNNLKYNLLLVLSKLPVIGGGNNLIIRVLRSEGCEIGINARIFSNITGEPYLVKIGDNCTISTCVSLITHDASIGLFMGRENYSDICGKIVIGNNCFIGSKAIILYGVTIPDNTIVAAGSVVTRSIETSGCILAGNPAKVVGYVNDFLCKSKPFMLSLHGKTSTAKKETILKSMKFIVR